MLFPNDNRTSDACSSDGEVNSQPILPSPILNSLIDYCTPRTTTMTRGEHNNNSNNNMDYNNAPRRRKTHKSASQRQKDAARHSFHTRLSLSLTAATIVGMLLLSALFSEKSSSLYPQENKEDDAQYYSAQERGLLWLQDSTNQTDENRTDYSSYSCHKIFRVTPTAGSAGQCHFAKTCNQGEGVWAPMVFCWQSTWLSVNAWCVLLSPIMLLWLILLFRMLGSTAEDYFSPALEMFSVELGLPPRFAGVTLLALGNGAADVSATVAAISNDPGSGYQLSLGALTGAAMVIGSVVSALVVLVAGGIPCRGALVRDVLALFFAICVVWKEMSTGVIGNEAVTLFLTLYAVFVMLVLVADVYHRAVVLPRWAALAQAEEAERQAAESQRALSLAAAAAAGTNPATAGGLLIPPHAAAAAGQQPPPPLAADGILPLSNVLAALSNYDNDPSTFLGPGDAGVVNNTGWGVESEDLVHERPVLLHGAHGLLGPNHHHPRQHGHHPGVVGGNAFVPGGMGLVGGDPGDLTANYSILQDTGGACVQTGQPGHVSVDWKHAWEEAQDELQQHCQTVWDDIVFNGDLHPIQKFLLLCELPFTALRQITVPIPCQGYYTRAIVALSTAISPLWFAFYLHHSHGISIVKDIPNGIFYFLGLWGALLATAAGLLRYAPTGQDGNLSLAVATPIALYGFLLAASWIDTIADSLVSLLDFIGIILRIPGPIVGLTILAWGNSMGDLSANITMARKGLANMAMTACFAGPLFNILIGLGLGFSTLEAKTGVTERPVTISASVLTGFIFIALNTVTILVTGIVLGQGRIPKNYGYIALTLYSLYLVTSIVLQYTSADSSGSGNSQH